MTDRPDKISAPIRGTGTLTVTLYGDNGQIDHALSAELGRRGCRTHAVSVNAGWLRSAQNVICRLDTEAGRRALEGLAGRHEARATVIAVCEKPTDPYDLDRLHSLCQECGRGHDVSLIWHSALAEDPVSGLAPIEHLAVSVADEVSARVNAAHHDFMERFVDLD